MFYQDHYGESIFLISSPLDEIHVWAMREHSKWPPGGHLVLFFYQNEFQSGPRGEFQLGPTLSELT